METLNTEIRNEDDQESKNLALCLAAFQGNLDLVKLLIKNGADKNCECNCFEYMQNSRKARASEWAHTMGNTQVEDYLNCGRVRGYLEEFEPVDEEFEPVDNDF